MKNLFLETFAYYLRNFKKTGKLCPSVACGTQYSILLSKWNKYHDSTKYFKPKCTCFLRKTWFPALGHVTLGVSRWRYKERQPVPIRDSLGSPLPALPSKLSSPLTLMEGLGPSDIGWVLMKSQFKSNQITGLLSLLQSEDWIVGYLTSHYIYTNTPHLLTRLILNTDKIWETFSPCRHGPNRTPWS